MTLTTPTTLVLTVLAAATAWTWGGALGTGVAAGFLAGATVAGLVLLVQRRVAATRPAYVVHAVLGGFLAKAMAMLVLTLTVRYVPALEAVCDPRTFLVAFAAAAIGILGPATFDTLRIVERRASAVRATPQELGAR
ncbi:MAG: hypothetical protein JNL28_02160 [Planctomycetes bacterium]|nr:hypothetical protein [Planctomycetota bacterium]